MKESFSSIKECLDSLEFCPICSKRSNVDLEFNNNKSYLTSLDNNNLKALTFSGRDKFTIDLNTNIVIHNNIKENIKSYLHLSCKGFHFSIIYELNNSNDTIKLEAKRLSFFIKDSKKGLNYNILSNYRERETVIQIADQTSSVQEMRQRLIDFKNFDKNNIIKRVRALSLLY